jgi:hypothetical protein
VDSTFVNLGARNTTTRVSQVTGAGKRPNRVDTQRVCVTVRQSSCALVCVNTRNSAAFVAAVARTGERACIVCTCRDTVNAVMRVERTLVVVSTRDTAAGVTQAAHAGERANDVGAYSIWSTIVQRNRALVCINTSKSVARVAGFTGAHERTRRVCASGHTTRSTVVRVQVAFVVVGTRDPATCVA